MKTCKLVNRKKFQFRKVPVGGMLLLSSLLAMPIAAQEKTTFHFSISEQSLDAALKEFGLVADRQVLFPTKLVAGLTVNPINGNYTAEEALQQMLKGSGLVFEGNGSGVLLLKQQEQASREVEKRPTSEIEEMVITATKRETSLQDTAMSISALGGDTIDKRGLVQMGDYLSTLPGVTIQERGAGQNSIVMRGIAVDPAFENEAVGAYFGETPVTGIGLYGSGHADFRMVDIERVEVLRGPQGTLYGSGSMGGTVRIIPAEPDLTQISGSISAGYSHTGELGGNNTTLEGVFNLPLIEDKLAVRAVAYRVDNSGYIENIAGSYQGSNAVLDKAQAYGGVARDIDDIGNDETTGFRLSALWQATDQLAITVTYARQDTKQQGISEVNLDLPGTYQQIGLLPGSAAPQTSEGDSMGPEGLQAEPRLTNVLVDYDLGWGSIHSSTSWVKYEGSRNEGWTHLSFTPGPYRSVALKYLDNFVEELRFTSNFDGPLQILAGIYYEDKDSRDVYAEGFSGSTEKAADYATDLQAFLGFTQAIPSDAPAGFAWTVWHQDTQPKSIKQKAFFGELTYDITDQISATLGLRHYDYDQTYQVIANGFWYATLSPILTTDAAYNYKDQSYKANLSWTPNEDTLVYAQWSEGFRLGDANPYIPQCDDNGFYDLVNGTRVPVRTGTDPDTLENFELGYKTSFADNRGTFNASLYHIDWQGLPVWVALACGTGGTSINVGESTSQGIELESRLSVTDNLLLDLSASWNEAKLAKESYGIGDKGDDLPGSADFNLSAGLEYGFDVGGYPAFTRIDYAYVGPYDTFVAQPASIPSSGDYHQVHIKAGVSIRNVDIDLFVHNLTNADDLTWTSPLGTYGSTRAYRLRPRTMGLNFSYHF